MPKKKIKKVSPMIRVTSYDHISKESFENFKDRLIAMPFNLLLTEHQTLSEYYGILNGKDDWWDEKTKDVFEKMMFVKDKLIEKVHSLQDYSYLLEYQIDEAYRLMHNKEKDNVKVSKKSTKQSK